MPMDMHWDDDAHTVIRVDIHPFATWDEFHITVDRIIWAMRTVSHRVDIIFNMDGLPSGNPIPQLDRNAATFAENDNLGIVMTASGHNALSALHSVIMRILGVYMFEAQHNGGFYPSMEAAYAAIARLREAELVT